MSKTKKLSFTMRYVLVFGILLLVANTILGFVVLNQSKNAMQSLIRKNMLDVVNSASGMLNGDYLAAMTADDADSPECREIIEKLRVVLNNVDIRFIYVVRREGEGRYIFIVDPDPETPADFGEEIVITSGLLKAGEGVAAVDDAPMADRWGNFYSAFSPVPDASGGVAAVVGIDFDAKWYDDEVRNHTLSITVVTILSGLIGGLIIFLITRRVRRQLGELGASLEALSGDVDRLVSEIGSMSGYQSAEPADGLSNELDAVGGRIRDMQGAMRLYMDYLQQKAYIDALTQVRSATAYHELLQKLDDSIASGEADFQVAVFDVKSLKETNDRFGHEQGDEIIAGAARAVAESFGTENTYRIGGDEFVAVVENLSDEEMADSLDRVRQGIQAFNASGGHGRARLAVSMGVARYLPGEDVEYRTVFARADQQMYVDKREYYRTVGNRRRQDES